MKKAIYYFTIILAFLLNACDNDLDNIQGGDNEILASSSEIVIKDGKITYPKWLVNVVDSVAHSHVKGADYPYPWVYTLEKEGKELILVQDGINSCATCSFLFYTLSGEQIVDIPTEWLTIENLDAIWPNLNVRQKLGEQPPQSIHPMEQSLVTLITVVKKCLLHKKRVLMSIGQRDILKRH